MLQLSLTPLSRIILWLISGVSSSSQQGLAVNALKPWISDCTCRLCLSLKLPSAVYQLLSRGYVTAENSSEFFQSERVRESVFPWGSAKHEDITSLEWYRTMIMEKTHVRSCPQVRYGTTSRRSTVDALQIFHLSLFNPTWFTWALFQVCGETVEWTTSLQQRVCIMP
jgi:hypothetical protein